MRRKARQASPVAVSLTRTARAGRGSRGSDGITRQPQTEPQRNRNGWIRPVVLIRPCDTITWPGPTGCPTSMLVRPSLCFCAMSAFQVDFVVQVVSDRCHVTDVAVAIECCPGRFPQQIRMSDLGLTQP